METGPELSAVHHSAESRSHLGSPEVHVSGNKLGASSRLNSCPFTFIVLKMHCVKMNVSPENQFVLICERYYNKTRPVLYDLAAADADFASLAVHHIKGSRWRYYRNRKCDNEHSVPMNSHKPLQAFPWRVLQVCSAPQTRRSQTTWTKCFPECSYTNFSPLPFAFLPHKSVRVSQMEEGGEMGKGAADLSCCNHFNIYGSRQRGGARFP